MVKLITKLIPNSDESWSQISDEAKDLISSMLTKEDVRPTAEQCLNHSWFVKDKKFKQSPVNISSRTIGRIK